MCGKSNSQTAATSALELNSLHCASWGLVSEVRPECWRRPRFSCAVWPNLDLTPRDTSLFLLPCSNTSILGSWPLMMKINPCVHFPIHPKAAGSAWSECSTAQASKLLLHDKTESSVSCKITGIPSCWNIRGFTAKCSLELNISATPLRLWCP